MVTIVDYGVGNLFSLRSSLKFIGVDAVVSGSEKVIRSAERLILPGVGAFADAAARLRETGLDEAVKRRAAQGVPVMGICLGMQLLFDQSLEYGEHRGLGLIRGTVRPISEVIPAGLKIPHIGWNALRYRGERHPIFRHVPEGEFVYFVHSYYAANCPEAQIAVADYGAELTAAVAKDNVCGCQFHPEKSGRVGLSILRGFCEWEG